MTDEEFIDFFETTIDDSFDLGWTSLDAAKLIVSRMQDKGLVIVKIRPDAVDRVARALCIADGLDPEHDLAGPDERYAPEWHQFRDLATAAIAAITGRV